MKLIGNNRLERIRLLLPSILEHRSNRSPKWLQREGQFQDAADRIKQREYVVDGSYLVYHTRTSVEGPQVVAEAFLKAAVSARVSLKDIPGTMEFEGECL